MDSGTYNCRINADALSGEAVCAIGREALQIKSDNKTLNVNYADLQDFRLLNYHLQLFTADGQIELSELGHQTEAFFQKLWEAYDARSREALFIEGEPLYEGEGDYAYSEHGVEQHGIARIALYDNCLCLCPHDRYARRVPLCFAEEPKTENFRITVTLDTGDQYQISRIGRHTDAVFEKMCATRKAVVKRWQNAHRELESHLAERLGERSAEYHAMEECGCKMICGLYAVDETGFWFEGLKDGKAAVELVTDEQTATYLYEYDTDDAAFERTLRHAMESAALHREVIFTDIADKPLYRMTVERSHHIEFLRAHNAGRIIHSGSWTERLREFFLNL